jgi:uncharacterized repeat protein (TIGR03803 family)
MKNLFVWSTLTVCTGFVLASHLSAQTLTTLHKFVGSDGANPYGGLILASNILYGTTFLGGAGNGTVFSVHTDGTVFKVLHKFTAGVDGAGPIGNLILAGNSLYGVAQSGGSLGANGGTIFAVNTDGSGFRILHSFPPVDCNGCPNSDGASPSDGLILLGNVLYGTAQFGGDSGAGTVFAINRDGTDFATLYSFSGGGDGAYPRAGLCSLGDTLYGTTFKGGNWDSGGIFSINTNGTGFMALYSFTAAAVQGTPNSDGANPSAGLVPSSNILYGTTYNGGSSGDGTVFKVNIDGTRLMTLHNFEGTNGDGSLPIGTLILSGRTLYGTTLAGGNGKSGTVFAIQSDGTGFAPLYNFIGSDGAEPWAGLIFLDSIVYGTTKYGGTTDDGTVFSISFSSIAAPQLTINPAGSSVVLSWATNFIGFTLQSTTNFGPSAKWTTNLLAPAIANGLNTVTNPISGKQQFFRLAQ